MPIRKKSQWLPFLWIETLQSYVLGEGWSGGIVVLLGLWIISVPEVVSRLPQMVSSTQATDKGKKTILECKSKSQWDTISHRSEWPWLKGLQMINAAECEEKGTLLYSWWECKMVQPLWRTVWRFLKKLKIESPYDRAIYSWT